MSDLRNTLENFETMEGLSKGSVDAAAGIVKRVKVIGFASKNGRAYSENSLRQGVHLYEGAKVNLDHPDKPRQPRSVRDRFGVLKGAHFVENEGIFADFHFNPKHEFAEQFAWEAENNPSNVGFSHNASVRGRRDAKGLVVEAIEGVKSVDLVADPATTKGVFESAGSEDSEELEGVISEKLRDDKEHQAFRKIVDAAISLMRQTLWNEELALSVMRGNVSSIASDLVSELSKPADTQESETMTGKNLKELTLEEIRAERPDLFESESEAELKTLREKLAAMELKESTRERADLIATEIEESKIPADKISANFRKVLEATEGVDDRKALLADLAGLVGVQESDGSDTRRKHETPKSTDVSEGVGSSSLSAAGLAKALKA